MIIAMQEGLDPELYNSVEDLKAFMLQEHNIAPSFTTKRATTDNYRIDFYNDELGKIEVYIYEFKQTSDGKPLKVA